MDKTIKVSPETHKKIKNVARIQRRSFKTIVELAVDIILDREGKHGKS